MQVNGNGNAVSGGDTIHGRFVGTDEADSATSGASGGNITILFSVKEECGALSKCLKIFEV